MGHPNDLLICVTVAMKVLVCGGRNFRSPAQVFRALDRLHQEKPIAELMQGRATGADQFAMEWAATKPEGGLNRSTQHFILEGNDGV